MTTPAQPVIFELPKTMAQAQAMQRAIFVLAMEAAKMVVKQQFALAMPEIMRC
jgi:hypothetical protein